MRLSLLGFARQRFGNDDRTSYNRKTGSHFLRINHQLYITVLTSYIMSNSPNFDLVPFRLRCMLEVRVEQKIEKRENERTKRNTHFRHNLKPASSQPFLVPRLTQNLRVIQNSTYL
jgi:hypothetical protein